MQVLVKRALFFRDPNAEQKPGKPPVGVMVRRSFLPQEVPEWVRGTYEFKLAAGDGSISELTAAAGARQP